MKLTSIPQYRGQIKLEKQRAQQARGGEDVGEDDDEDEPVVKKGSKQKRVYGKVRHLLNFITSMLKILQVLSTQNGLKLRR